MNATDTASILLLAGQSNMGGQARVADLTPGFETAPSTVRLFEQGEFRPVPWRNTFGPELGLAHSLAKCYPDRHFVFCKVARGGASLYHDWNPDEPKVGDANTYSGPLYRKLLAQYQACINALVTEGLGATITGLLWMQGEYDSGVEHMANSYGSNLTNFINRIRTDFHSMSMPVVLGKVSTRYLDPNTGKPKHIYREIIRGAQENVSSEMADVILVETDDLTQSDALHYDAAGQLLLGERFALALEKLWKSGVEA